MTDQSPSHQQNVVDDYPPPPPPPPPSNPLPSSSSVGRDRSLSPRHRSSSRSRYYDDRRHYRDDDRRYSSRDHHRDRYDSYPRRDHYYDRYDRDRYGSSRYDRDRYRDRYDDRRGSRYPPRTRQRRPVYRGSEQDRKTTTTIYAGNLPYDFIERDVANMFERYGRLKSVTVPMDTVTNKNKGFAFIEFEDRRDAEEAYDKFDGFSVEGRRLRLDW
ncbi:uncharacterized protein BX663DRAFT_441573 [Cokeromyces recurvatus]|uniref:uncharacterized protein n=1 Tax=Cokeromyces recurvatus TaxID=90255 RepID=UPI0022211B38|nr:uncharacterized protein BX663DRAFT_441573 [Cokeromyces recurvatus]KAI7899193.1 hypothetical protein BX663DRAFT_441573 [Cokeromyces recurvatus]